jgi:hypothetical protein
MMALNLIDGLAVAAIVKFCDAVLKNKCAVSMQRHALKKQLHDYVGNHYKTNSFEKHFDFDGLTDYILKVAMIEIEDYVFNFERELKPEKLLRIKLKAYKFSVIQDNESIISEFVYVVMEIVTDFYKTRTIKKDGLIVSIIVDEVEAIIQKELAPIKKQIEEQSRGIDERFDELVEHIEFIKHSNQTNKKPPENPKIWISSDKSFEIVIKKENIPITNLRKPEPKKEKTLMAQNTALQQFKYTITQALQQLRDWGVDFTDPRKTNSIIKDLRIEKADRLLLETAIIDMKAYDLLQKAKINNVSNAIEKLSQEMNTRHRADKEVALIIIERIAVILVGFPEQQSLLFEKQEQPVIIQTKSDSSLPYALINGNEAEIDNIIDFGPYKWRVLDLKDGKALIITEDVIEHHPYHNLAYTDVTWETCNLRFYLNNEFLLKFEEKERNQIVEIENNNTDNLWYDTKGGNITNDKIFLLSLDEIDYYFGNSGDYSNKRRKFWNYTNMKFYPKDDGNILSNNHDSSRVAKYNNGTCWWWIRTPGHCSSSASDVSDYGYVRVRGDDSLYLSKGVRPALWLKLYF